MNRRLLLLSAAATAALFGQTVPRPAPAFGITTLAGQKIQISDYKGKVVLLAGLLTT